ncbi:MAG: hypothetical protein L6R40_001640 [Gallowayella cf. fulva]|nr:MAG: hypothetical protein L6R40_001640 [Xanthomendoza cf. fulva]
MSGLQDRDHYGNVVLLDEMVGMLAPCIFVDATPLGSPGRDVEIGQGTATKCNAPLLSSLLPFAFLLASIAASTVISQIPFAPDAVSDEPNNHFKWLGPGLYRLISYATQYAASLNDTSEGASIVAKPSNGTDDTQVWLLAVYTRNESGVLLFNKATGGLLSAYQSKKPTRAVATPPHDKKARWSMDFDTYKNIPGNPVVSVPLLPLFDLSKQQLTMAEQVF